MSNSLLLLPLPPSSSSYSQPHSPLTLTFFNSRRKRRPCRYSRATMCSSHNSHPPNDVVVGCGAASVDFLATVASYPNPDDKIRSINLKVQGGGNAGNALTCVARLGLKPRIISKVADDSQGRSILDELHADGVDASFIVVSEEGTSPFTYIIVDNETKTRTCIHTPGYPPMIPQDLSESSLLTALNGASIAYFDGRLYETALVVAQEAVRKNIPILVDAERPREGLDDLLKFANYVVCSAKFPLAWTGASTFPQALVSILLRLPNIRFVIVTLGKDGCIMLERNLDVASSTEEVDIDSLVESLKTTTNESVLHPTCISSSVATLKAEGIGTVNGRIYVGTAESIPPLELIDTTGAGDAFIGAVIYAICANFSPETMLSFAANVAAAKCRDLGARSGLPYRADPRIASFMQ
ncbi:hypothetical protein HN51_021879 [Arachis hypogaea]|uniref:Carbohydrate kinase PfkB domain-containing protein n=2 Tax=Arachis TaxID=3817 RepID=A0A445EE45_ARAHY|nr:uncharacterized protein LOC107473942 isoform X1 [Arachis duranensis]QHO52988.1 Ribokinase [Arachis hypogaea]RYR73780.1 hypothetical protein Ahy_A02g008275 [Arachis hypogaea]